MANNINMMITANTSPAQKSIKSLCEKLTNIQTSVRDDVFKFAKINKALFKFTSKFTSAIADMNKLSDSTGISIDKLQRLKYVAEQTNSSGEALFGTLQELTKRIENAASGSDETFSKLDISVRGANGQIKNAAEILEEVGQQLKLIDNVQIKQDILSGLGIDDSLYEMLNLTNKEMQEYIKEVDEVGIISKEDAKRAEAFHKQIGRVKSKFNILSAELALNFMPVFSKMLDKFEEFVRLNRNDIREFGQGIAAVFSKVSEVIIFFWNLLVDVFGAKGAGYIVGIALLALIIPIKKICNLFKLLIFSFGLLKGLFKWLINLFKGLFLGKGFGSSFKWLKDLFKWLGSSFKWVKNLLKGLFSSKGLRSSFKLLKNLFKGLCFGKGLRSSFRLLKNLFKGLFSGKWLSSSFRWVKNLFKGLFSSKGASSSFGLLKNLFKWLRSSFKWFKNLFKGLFLGKGFGSSFRWMKNLFKGLFSGKWLSSSFKWLKDSFRGLFSVKGPASGWSGKLKSFDKLAKGAKGPASGWSGKLKSFGKLAKGGLMGTVFGLAIEDVYYGITGKGKSISGNFFKWLTADGISGVFENLNKAFGGLIIETYDLFGFKDAGRKAADKWDRFIYHPIDTTLKALSDLLPDTTNVQISKSVDDKATMPTQDQWYIMNNMIAGMPQGITVTNNINVNATSSDPNVVGKVVIDNLNPYLTLSTYTGGGR
ncbi:MAG: phage tail tape measure protein [Campylobacteraceae bacterium]|jgi:predicted DNA-binding protein YlxM (UPF0122 family)|nr:phage tail tape measure protein [Campylobacteraceae bacterium]